jgi:hypothetical protein
VHYLLEKCLKHRLDLLRIINQISLIPAIASLMSSFKTDLTNGLSGWIVHRNRLGQPKKRGYGVREIGPVGGRKNRPRIRVWQ